MDISTLISNYQTYEELKIFVEAQYKQIVNLTKKNKDLQEKLDKAGKAPIYFASATEAGAGLAPQALLAVSKEDAKIISEIQLSMLRQASMERELNTDEAKRVELYNRILKDDSAKDKSQDTLKAASNAELLKLVE